MQQKVKRTDNSEEYVDYKLRQIQTTNAQQNGLAERTNRTVLEKARTAFAESNLPVVYWVIPIIAHYLIKMSLAAEIMETPREIWKKGKSD